MSELINRQMAIDALRNTKFRNDLFLDIGYKNAINIIESLPRVQYFLTCEGCKWLRLPNGCANDRCARMYKDRYEAERRTDG